VDVSVVIPCLNEAATIGDVVARAVAALSARGVSFEVIVADNGSTDGSRDRAEEAGARIVDASALKGAGAATKIGALSSGGEVLVFLDADGEHDPAELGKLLEAAAESPNALVLGSRSYMQGAGSLINRALGTPGLTFLINHYFGTRIRDCNTGFRAMRREVFERIDFEATGFEFCAEMVVRCGLLGVPIVEVPIVQHPAPEGRRPHLRRFRDGWRHLKFILLHAPDRVLLRPGFAICALGALLFVPQMAGRFEHAGIVLDIHFMILGALFLMIGAEMLGSAIVCATIAGEPTAPMGRLSRRLGKHFSLDRMLPPAALLFLVGFACDVAVLVKSAALGWRDLTEPRLALIGTSAMGLAVQLVVLSFVHSVVGIHRVPSQLSKVERISRREAA
jgi:glycosyltransferase involved in cell wall biosynthesis